MNKRNILIICLFALISSNVIATEVDNCMLLSVNTAFFNMCPYTRDAPFTQTLDDGGDNLVVTFTLGMANTSNCNGTGQIWATLNDTNLGECYDLALDSPSLSLVDQSSETSGLVSTFPLNIDSGYGKYLIVTLACDSSAGVNDATTWNSINETDAYIAINGTSYYGCPYVTLNQIVNFLEEYKYPFIAVGVILGIFLIFFGLKMFAAAVFIITTITGALFSCMLFFEFVKFGTQQWVLWVIFAACFIIGCVLGYLAVRYERIGFFALGAALGVVGGFFLYNAVLIQFTSGNAIFYVILVVLGLIGGGLGLWLWKDIIIISTSLVGSYMGVRSVSVVIGGFPNELAVAKGVANLSGFAYLYLAIIVLIAVGGMYYQFREKKRLEDEEDQDTYSAFYKR